LAAGRHGACHQASQHRGAQGHAGRGADGLEFGPGRASSNDRSTDGSSGECGSDAPVPNRNSCRDLEHVGGRGSRLENIVSRAGRLQSSGIRSCQSIQDPAHVLRQDFGWYGARGPGSRARPSQTCSGRSEGLRRIASGAIGQRRSDTPRPALDRSGSDRNPDCDAAGNEARGDERDSRGPGQGVSQHGHCRIHHGTALQSDVRSHRVRTGHGPDSRLYVHVHVRRLSRLENSRPENRAPPMASRQASCTR